MNQGLPNYSPKFCKKSQIFRNKKIYFSYIEDLKDFCVGKFQNFF